MPAHWKNIISLIIGLFLAFMIIEGILRVYNPIEQRIKGDKIVLPVNKKYIFRKVNIRGIDDPVVHTKNSLGFRGPELPPGGLNDYLSIITIGGSTTECSVLSDGKDWPAVLYKKLQTDFENIWLNNAGLDGHSTFGHIILMEDYIIKLKPTLALFLIGINDVGIANPTYHDHLVIREGVQFSSFKAFFKSLSLYSETVSLALNLFRWAKAEVQGLTHHNVDLQSLPLINYPEPGLDSLLEFHRSKYIPGFYGRLETLIRLARTNGIEPVFITQPALFGYGIDDRTQVDLGKVQVNRHSGNTNWKILELYNKATIKAGKSFSVFVIDAAGEMRKSSTNFYDFVHFTNEGAREFGNIVYQHLKKHLKETYPKRLQEQKAG
ncbi:MAG: hypothetical protein GXO92_03720 [FCB group bacterium]|nr:hypothetical protein [FCB group bacterium]